MCHHAPLLIKFWIKCDQFTLCCLPHSLCVPSPYSSIQSIRQSYVILIEFEWNGLKVSEVDNLENRKFLEASYLNL